MTWFVYILACRGGALYTGVTTDITRRYAQHVAGKGARYTRAFPPERISASWPCMNQRVALQLEYAIKQLNVVQKNALVAGERIELPKGLRLENGVWICVEFADAPQLGASVSEN